MRKLTPTLPVHIEDGVRVVHAWTRCGAVVTLEADDYAALWTGKRSLTLTLRPFNGKQYVTHAVDCGTHRRAHPVARTIMKPAEGELVCMVDENPLRLVKTNLRRVPRGSVSAWRRAGLMNLQADPTTD